MTPERMAHVRAHFRRIFTEHDVTRMAVSAVWRLLLQAEVFTEAEIDELIREAGARGGFVEVHADPGDAPARSRRRASSGR